MKLSTAKSLKGYQMQCLDGEIGKAREFYFDDRYWAVRYLVADTGDWLTDKQVLISPYALVGVMTEKKQIVVNLTKKQIEDSPSLETDKPVSRQYEDVYHGHYGWPRYWGGPEMWGTYPYIMRDTEQHRDMGAGEKEWDPHLLSTHDVTGYDIHASDGVIGHIEDFVIDDETWAIRYLIIATRNWLPGKKVLVSPKWIESVNWSESSITTNFTREAIKQSPEYTEDSLLTRAYELGLHQHYGRAQYWGD